MVNFEGQFRRSISKDRTSVVGRSLPQPPRPGQRPSLELERVWQGPDVQTPESSFGFFPGRERWESGVLSPQLFRERLRESGAPGATRARILWTRFFRGYRNDFNLKCRESVRIFKETGRIKSPSHTACSFDSVSLNLLSTD